MAMTNRPYDDDKIVELAKALPDEAKLAETARDVSVIFNHESPIHTEITWITTITTTAEEARRILDAAEES